MAGQTYPIYACTGTNHARHFIGSRYIFAASKIFKVTLEKKLIGRKSRVYGTILIYNLWENHANLNGIDSKRSTSRSFQGHNLHPRVHALSFIFFSLRIIFLNYFPYLKAINCKIKIYVTVLVRVLKTVISLYLIHGLKNNTMLLECARASPFPQLYDFHAE